MLLSYDQVVAQHPEAVAALAKSSNQEAKREKLEAEFRKRTGVFTASEIHKLLTKKGERAANATSQSYTLAKAFERLTGESARNSSGFIETEWGNFYESEAVNALKMRFPGITRTGDEQQFMMAKGYNFGATPDGLMGEKGCIEIKCPFNGGIHLENVAFAKDVHHREPPEESAKNLAWLLANRFEYYCQMQGAMWATEREWCLFVSYEPAKSRDRDPLERRDIPFPILKQLHVVSIKRDDSFIDKLKKAVVDATEELEKIVADLKASEL